MCFTEKNRGYQMKILYGLLIAVLLMGCNSKPESIGELDNIYVFADSSDWQDYRDAIHSHFMKETLTPVPEPEYQVWWRPFSEFNKYKYQNNIFFIGRLDGQDSVSLTIKSLLNKEIIDGIKSGKFFYIPKHDVWAKNQYVVFMVAPNRDEMLQRIYDIGELVYEDFEKSYYHRLRKKMFDFEKNKKLEEYLAEKYPFTVTAQLDYKLVDESEIEHYVWLRRITGNRDRSLAIKWFDNADSITITTEWMIQQRNLLAEKLYAGDVVVREETTAEQVRFQNWSALRLEGTWKNPKHMVGGPFRTIAFKDSETNRVYMIDFYVQAIGERKKVFLDQLDVIAHTFRLVKQKPKS